MPMVTIRLKGNSWYNIWVWKCNKPLRLGLCNTQLACVDYRKSNQGITSFHLFGLFLPHSSGTDTEVPIHFFLTKPNDCQFVSTLKPEIKTRIPHKPRAAFTKWLFFSEQVTVIWTFLGRDSANKKSKDYNLLFYFMSWKGSPKSLFCSL